MSKQTNQKLKLLYLKDYLEKETDERHPTTVKRIIEYMKSLGISCERKTVYSDIEELKKYGMDIISTRGQNAGYFVGERDFQPVELRLLIDAVNSSRFLTPKKTASLIERLSGLASTHERRWLCNALIDEQSLKSPNEQIFITLVSLYHAVQRNLIITFKYWTYSSRKEKTYKKDGGLYTVAPYLITTGDNNYYLIGKDMDEDKLKTFRADKIEHVGITDRNAPERPDEKILSGFVKSRFSIYDGETTSVTLRFDEALSGVILDKFGKEVHLTRHRDGTTTLTAGTKISIWFYSWLVGLGTQAEIISPESVRREYLDYLAGIIESYNTSSVD